MITTERLSIEVLSDEAMRKLISEETDKEMKEAYGQMLEGAIKYPDQRSWYAVWDIKLNSGKRIGDLCFKGLSPEGVVEIGYGLIPECWGKGYATEAVIEMTKWALSQPGVTLVEAETDPDNIASQKVLSKAGFKPNGVMGEEGPRFEYKG